MEMPRGYKNPPPEPNAVADLRRGVTSKLELLNTARQGMTPEQLQDLDIHLSAALQDGAESARDEIERFAHLVLTATGGNPLSPDGSGMSDDQVTRFLLAIRPSMREIITHMGKVDWPDAELAENLGAPIPPSQNDE